MREQMDEILTIDGVAAHFGADKFALDRIVSHGMASAFKLGGTWLFRWSDLVHWIFSRVGKGMADYKGEE